MNYREFGNLRFLDFFPKTAAYWEDHEGGVETGIGVVCVEGYQDTIFTSPSDGRWQTAEMILELGGDCPEAEGHALLDRLGLGLRKSMTAAQIEAVLGRPVKDTTDCNRLMRFMLGDKHPYYISCLIVEDRLWRVYIGRKDLGFVHTQLRVMRR
jgi:hypothetical protein